MSVLVVVENASTDGSAAYLHEHPPDLELLALPENRGYAGGANVRLQTTFGVASSTLAGVGASGSGAIRHRCADQV